MTGVDLLVFGMLVLIVYSGARRGLIMETTDWCVFVAGTMVALRWYRPLAESLRFVGWEQFALRIWSGVLLFGLVGLPTVLAGMVLERNYGHQLPKSLTQACGVLLALAKALLLSWVGLVALWYFPSEAESRQQWARGPVISPVMRLAAPYAEEYVNAVAPRSVAVDLVPVMKTWRF